MCIICVELLKQKITMDQAQEMAKVLKTTVNDDHYLLLELALERLDLELLADLLENTANKLKREEKLMQNQ